LSILPGVEKNSQTYRNNHRYKYWQHWSQSGIVTSHVFILLKTINLSFLAVFIFLFVIFHEIYLYLSCFIVFISRGEPQVPHSQCSLRENPKFLQNFRSKSNTLRENSWLIFFLNICRCNSSLEFKSENYSLASQNCMYFLRENSPKLSQKCKWALWMGHLGILKNNSNIDSCHLTWGKIRGQVFTHT
jgi:hypothetical protein